MYNVEKKYHFYAGHRNENLHDKCSNLHGHTYYITMQFEFNYNPKTGITFLFSDIDDVVDPIIKQLDHGLLIHNNDPLLKYLNDFMKTEKTSLKLTIMEDVTSAENLCKFIYNKVSEHLPIKKITLQETTSSIVTYEISN
ncbi:MAG: putative 6-carboxy-5 6 7 8-tetrahydropterin synthase [Prokaryotic dsDNA virus sp.]|nr:MAG: putative 6-carboxy-5 6 7 8-tetrahydropterin synthase [Prokaryotic dsDNA virus sp.]|tara:strand:+ start:6049 stop:6468 length:420 start_codon:yes stop_codon:yes gene_type:complete